jgi:hypothetical protein
MGLVKKHGVGAEIGVFRARFSGRIIDIAQPRLFYLFDAWRRLPGMLETMTNAWHRINLFKAVTSMNRHIANGSVRPVCCLAREAPGFVEDNSLDWVYIDADHSYKACLADLAGWWPKVKSGGYVMGHDHHQKREPGVVAAVAEFGRKMRLPEPILTCDSIPSYGWVKP